MLNIRILVVDDHGTLRKRIADYLRAQEGVEEVAKAANGVEALKCLRESRFDVMITDLVMPLMDGYMLLEELPRQIDPPPKTIVMSALSRDDFVTRAIDGVLNFENHDYLFFCARPTFDGYHSFARTYGEHLANARAYSAELNRRNIK